MKEIKHILVGDSIETKIKNTLLTVVGENFRQELLEFYDFYKIRGVLEGDHLKISIYFETEEGWRDVATINLETNEIEHHIDPKLLKIMLTRENNQIIQNSDKEIQRTTTIILSLIAFILGVVFAIVLVNIAKSF